MTLRYGLDDDQYQRHVQGLPPGQAPPTELAEVIPAPANVARTLSYTWDRPRRYGWPIIAMPPEHRGSQPRSGLIAPRRVRVQVQDSGQPGEGPKVTHIQVRGTWQLNGRETGWVSLKFAGGGYSTIRTDAPDWVLDMAAEAQRLAEREVAR